MTDERIRIHRLAPEKLRKLHALTPSDILEYGPLQYWKDVATQIYHLTGFFPPQIGVADLPLATIFKAAREARIALKTTGDVYGALDEEAHRILEKLAMRIADFYWMPGGRLLETISSFNDTIIQYVEGTIRVGDREGHHLREVHECCVGGILALLDLDVGLQVLFGHLGRMLAHDADDPRQAERNVLVGVLVVRGLVTYFHRALAPGLLEDSFWHSVVMGAHSPYPQNACCAYLVSRAATSSTVVGAPEVAAFVLHCMTNVLPIVAHRPTRPASTFTMSNQLALFVTAIDKDPNLLNAAEHSPFLDAVVKAIHVSLPLYDPAEAKRHMRLVVAFIGEHAAWLRDFSRAQDVIQELAVVFPTLAAMLTQASEAIQEAGEVRQWSAVRAAWLAAVLRAMPAEGAAQVGRHLRRTRPRF